MGKFQNAVIYTVGLLLILSLLSCVGTRNRGWATDFSTNLNPGRYESYSARGWALDFGSHSNPRRYNQRSNRGWATDFSTNLNPGRYENYSARGWALDFGSHSNSRRYNQRNNRGWATDFSTNLNPNRFERFNSGFAVFPKKKPTRIKLSGSFDVSPQRQQGGFAFSEKHRSVQPRRTLFRRKPAFNDAFSRQPTRSEARQNRFNKRKRRVIQRRSWFRRDRERPYRRRKNMDLELFPFEMRGNT